MKQLFIRVGLIFALIFASQSYAQSKEEINVLWAFNIGSTQANVLRSTVAELNKIQNKYTFSLVHKPGAGGTIAANTVAANPQNTIVGMSSSFIIRPYYEKDNTHNLDRFTPLYVQGNGSPIMFLSKKYSSFDQAVSAKSLTIGVSGVGSISHLAANELKEVNKNIVIVNFRNMIDAATAAAGGHVDIALAFYSDAAGLIDSKNLNVLAYTGQQELSGVPGAPAYKHNLPDLTGITANYAIYASSDMDANRLKELHQLIGLVQKNADIVAGYQKDFLTTVNFSLERNKTWYSSERKFWKKKVDDVNVSLIQKD